MQRQVVRLGIDRVVDECRSTLEGKRFGVVVNQASVTSDFRYSLDALIEEFQAQVVAAFAPQHGLWGEQQANMVESPDLVDEEHSIPIYSLYGAVRWPTPEMLEGLDCLVIDLQDVGTRVYTYIWTLSYCLEQCGKLGVEVVILDRPNPLGGTVTEGPVLRPAFASFVGRYEIPMRHGLTIGEFAVWANQHYQLGAKIEVVPLQGWQRRQVFSECRSTWIPPSPNMPRYESAYMYPGMVLLEGTNLSEGRGTTRPFEVIGAPYIDPVILAKDMKARRFLGVEILPIRFEPTFDKWQAESCGGVAFYVTQPQLLRSYELTIAVLGIVQKHWPEEFAWLPPPYEYEAEKMPIDILSGSQELREALVGNFDLDLTVERLSRTDDHWLQDKPLLYD